MVDCNSDSYSAQIAWSVFILLIGLIFFVLWAVIYSNRVNIDIPVEWWSWIFLGFGLFFMIIGIVWLIISLYGYSTKKRSCCAMHHAMNEKKEMGLSEHNYNINTSPRPKEE